MRFLSSLLLASALVLVGCSSYDVVTDFNPSTDFRAYRSFVVKKDAKIPGDVLQENTFTRDRVYTAIENALIARGFTLAEYGDADIVIMTYAGVKERVNLSTYGFSTGPYWGGPMGWGAPMGGGMVSTQTVATTFNEGTLHIDILDAKEKSLVWKGRGTGVIEKSRNPREREQMVNEAVGEILADFPPR